MANFVTAFFITAAIFFTEKDEPFNTKATMTRIA